MRGNTSLRNPFRYQYWQIRPFEEWKSLEEETRSRPAKRARTVASVPEEPGAVVAGLRQWLDTELECTICKHLFISPHSVNGCGHTFCHGCLSRWFSEHSLHCPICRHRVIQTPSFSLTPCYRSQNLLDRYVLPSLSPEDAEARRVLVRDNAAEQAARRAADARRATFAQSLLPTIIPARMQIETRGSMTRLRAASSRPQIRAVSRSAETSTDCCQCRVFIPALFLRFRRTTTASGVVTNEYFHANGVCLRSIRHELANTILSPELSEQEKRVTTGVINLLRRVTTGVNLTRS